MNPSQYRLAAELVEMIHEDFQGENKGTRRATRETLIEQKRYGRRLYLCSADTITNDYKLATMATDAQVISFNAKQKEQSGAYDESR